MSEGTVPYAKVFPNVVALVDHVLDLAKEKKSLAFALGDSQKPRYGVSNVRDTNALTFFAIRARLPFDRGQGFYIVFPQDRAFLSEVTTVTTRVAIRNFNKPVGEGYAGESMNGRAGQVRIFPTTIPGLRLQVVNWREWWQAFGGGDVGGFEFVWLLNHDPVATER